MGLNTFGTDEFLRFLIRNRMYHLREDDKLIKAEGVSELTIPELIHACSSRGIRTVGVSASRLRQELEQWLELSVKHKVPGTLLILSRAFSLLDRVPAAATDALQATLSSLPDELVKEVDLRVSEAAGAATSAQKLEVIKEQEELIADEREQKERDLAEWEAQQKEEKVKEEAAKVDISFTSHKTP